MKKKKLLFILIGFLCVFAICAIIQLFRSSNQKIVFVSTRNNGGVALYTMTPNGDNQIRISDQEEPQNELWFRFKINLPQSLHHFLPSHIYNIKPIWSPNGDYIAYSAISKSGGSLELFLMDTRWMTKKRLTYSNGVYSYPAWSPDSSAIAYTSANRLCIIRLSTFKTDCITSSDIYTPTWSPDSKELAYTYQNDLYVIGLDDKKPKFIIQEAKDPKWSPINNSIVYIRTTTTQICSINSDGMEFVQLTNNDDDIVNVNPVWSPNGQKIVFERLLYSQKNFEIFIMNHDGSGLSNLTNNSFSDTQPTWSPDNNYIAFTSTRDGNNEIYTMDIYNKNVTRLTYTSADDYAPSWHP